MLALSISLCVSFSFSFFCFLSVSEAFAWRAKEQEWFTAFSHLTAQLDAAVQTQTQLHKQIDEYEVRSKAQEKHIAELERKNVEFAMTLPLSSASASVAPAADGARVVIGRLVLVSVWRATNLECPKKKRKQKM